jgi:hypothetical protein
MDSSHDKSRTIDHIDQLIAEACKFPRGHLQRNRYLSQVVREISPRLWRENTPYYEEALQQTWLFFSKNACNAHSSERGNIVTWLNTYLKWRLIDARREVIEHFNHTISISNINSELNISIIDSIPDERGDSDMAMKLLEELQNWVNSNEELDKIFLGDRSDITAKKLISMRLPPATSWKDISEELNASLSTLSSFYNRKCLPILKKYREDMGLL